MLVNILVAYSSLLPILYIKDMNPIILVPMTASFVYHLSETKHNLPGIEFLRDYSSILLNIDRIFAVISFLYGLVNLFKDPKRQYIFYIIGFIGIFSLLYSEKDYILGSSVQIGPITHTEFLISHSILHLCAFWCLSQL